VLLPYVPTVENLARIAFTLLTKPLLEHGLKLTHLRLYETPNCWADRYAS
jgi:6-pyruvoyltetrahydropterin/6-carboxytetrahydropterin synthase